MLLKSIKSFLISLKVGISVNIYKNTKKLILKSLYSNFNNLNEDLENKITCEQPKNSKFGDISSNVILVVSKTLNLDKKKIYEVIIKSLLKNEFIIKANFIDPGFLNLYFSNDYWLDFLKKINLEGDNFGFSNIGKNKKINVEFVSANPTGPLHIGHLRGAIFGDVLSKLLTKAGFRVTKEYYVNNLGAQVDNLAATVQHHVNNKIKSESIPLSENMYKGEYLKKIADKYKVSSSTEIDNLDKIKVFSVKKNLELIQKDLINLGISFDNYVYEKKIHEIGLMKKIYEILEKNGDIYYGVLEQPKGKELLDWKPIKQLLFRSSSYGDKSDRVMQKENGDWTYFASDIAYHYDKASRGYDEIINVWGADHAGYIDRIRAALIALGFKNTTFTVKLCQIVNLIDKKKVIKMSKRDGNFILVSDILPKLGKDVLRFFMLTRKNDAHLDFDVEKCVNETSENPSFYVQYAYARISSIKRHATEKKQKINKKDIKFNSNSLSVPEINLIKSLSLWPKIIESAVIFREPHRIVYFLIDLAGSFHSYWSLGKSDKKYKILSEENLELANVRFLILDMIQTVLKSGLELLSVSVKDKM